MQINATQAAGVAGFGVAALLAWAAARASRRDAGTWRTIAVVHALLAAEVVAGLRHSLTRLAMHLWVGLDDYAGRRAPQALLVIVLAAAGLVVALRMVARMRRRGGAARNAAALTIAAVTLFAVETVSLHQVDAVLFRPVGQLPAIGWLWLGLGLAVGLCALASTGRRG